ncbi:MAG: DUF1592 domain-containing protein [Pirellulaceae bacterium]
MTACTAATPYPSVVRFRTAVSWLLVGAGLLPGAFVLGAEDPPGSGKEIYATLCAGCHGPLGEGVPGHCDRPFQGSYALADLIQIVDETMPEDDPEACTGDSAEQVARYIFETFYHPTAQRLASQARVELARLTVRQYEHAVADLIGTFVGEGSDDGQRGLKANFFANREFARDKLAIERVDAQVFFTYGEGSPHAEKIAPEEFSAQWSGAILADETGDYEFCVTTENGARLWVNDLENPLIDAWVVSGNATEHRATVRLLGGRTYPIRMHYSKSKPQNTASIVLCWAPPHKAEETIPTRNLLPHEFPPSYVVKQPFPPDDSSGGYPRGTTVSREWDQAQTYAALEIASEVVRNLEKLADCQEESPDRAERIKQFCHRFAERAWRRPLTEEEKQTLVEQHFAGETLPELAAKKVVLLVLMSPRFLYLEADAQQEDGYRIASRLSFGLWDSLPDAALLEAARSGQLRTSEQLSAQIRRMLPDYRTKAKLRDFLHHWLNIDDVENISKDQELFGRFDDQLAASLRTSLDLFLDDVIWNGDGDFRQLLLANTWFVDESIAAYYGIAGEYDDGYRKVAMDSDRSAGILTHPYLMARFAYHKSSSPIHRGVFVMRSLLGRFLKPPPIAVAPADEGVDPNLTTRQRVAQQTNEPTCQTCHSMINALGFSFEHYDAVGKFRTVEKDQPIDASGHYQDLEGEQADFVGARQLAEFLAACPETHRCFIQQLFHHVVKQPVMAYGPETMSKLEKSFAESGFDIQELLIEILTMSALRTHQES